MSGGLRRWIAERRPVVSDDPVLVAGAPKSGTTAIARLLGVATGLDVSNDPFNRLDERGVPFRDALYGDASLLDDLVDGHPDLFAAPIVKDPNFVFFVPALTARFPESRWIFIVRDPRANIRSILNRLGIGGAEDPVSLEGKLRGVTDTWRRVVEGRTPDVEGDDYIERLAHRWNLAVEAYRGNEERMRLVRYETFDADKEAAIADLAAAMGLDAVRALGAAADRQYQPAGDRSTPWREFFGAANLARIEEICGERMSELGYGASDAPAGP